jgi:outer membrane protein TolC
MKYKSFAIFIFLQIILTNIFAQDLLTLEDVIRIGIEKNYDIRLAKNDTKAAQINNTKGNAGMLPRVNANLSDNVSNSSIYQVLANGSEISRNFAFLNGLNANVTGTWTVFDGYRMYATKQRLEELVKLGELNTTAQIQNTVAAISNAYYDIVRQQLQLRISDTLMLITGERVRLSELRFSAGVAAKMDFLQSQVDLNVLKTNRLRLEANIMQAKANLNLLLYRTPGTSFSVDPNIELGVLNQQDIEQGVKQKNAALQALSQSKLIGSITKKEISAARLPTVALNSAVIYNLNNAQAGFTLTNRNIGLNVGFSASMPLYDAHNTSRLEQLADLDMDSKQLQYERMEAMLMQQVAKQFTEYSVAREQLRMEANNLPLIQENLKIVSERFRLGQSANILEIKEIQRQYEDSFNRSINAKYLAKLVEIELKRIGGM